MIESEEEVDSLKSYKWYTIIKEKLEDDIYCTDDPTYVKAQIMLERQFKVFFKELKELYEGLENED